MIGFGDSITAGTGATTEAQRWANIVASTRGWSLINSGISATVLQNTVQNTVAVIGGAVTNNGRDTAATRVTQYTPGRVCILYGLNDLRLNDAAISAENYQNDLGEVVDAIVTAGTPANQIVIGSPPYIPSDSYAENAPWNGGTAEKHATYVAAAAAVAASKGTKYIDVYAWMLANGGDTLISADGIHPNDAGHAQIAAAFLSVI